MKSFLKYYLFAVFWGIFLQLPYLGNEQLRLSDIILKLSFSEFAIDSTYLILFTMYFLPVLVFQIQFGTYLYRHFCTASVYYFSRCGNRITWFLKETALLLPHCICYPIVLAASGLLLRVVTGVSIQPFDFVDFLLLFYYVLIHSLWLFFTTLLINICSMKLGSGIGFVIMGSIQMVSILLFLLWETVLPLQDAEQVMKNGPLLKFNPLSHLNLVWHSSRNPLLNQRIDRLGISFDLNESIILYLFISIVVIWFGCIMIKKHDLIVSNRETGGAE